MSAFGNWGTGLAEWQIGNVAYLSVVFSWQLQEAYQRAVWLGRQGYHVRAGGPAVALNPDAMREVASLGGQQVDALPYHNPRATFTSRGCIRKCPFCIVPVTEGELVELDDWEPRPIVCDNNLLACSRKHFDEVIDRLKPVREIDIQGLDARLLVKHHAQRMAELDLKAVHIGWDDTRLESQFLAAFEQLRKAGIPSRKIRVYVLLGFQDTPEDALYRLETIKALGAWPNPMRYQPLDTEVRNSYVAPGWTDRKLKRFTRYWSRLAWLEHIPFEEYRG